MKILTKLLSLIALSVLLQAPVSAHTMMTAASPANGEVLTVAPEHFTVQYSKPVRLVKLSLLDVNENKIKLAHQLAKVSSTDHQIVLPTLAAGQYKLNWILMGKDGHKMKGKLSFSITGETK